MTNRKKRQLSVLTAPNPVGQEPANERIFTPIHRGRADKERLVDEIMALHPGLERETIRMVIDLENRVVLDLLLEGVRVNNGLFEAHVACRGTVEGGIWQEGHNQLYLNFRPTRATASELDAVRVKVSGPRGSAIHIASTEDLSTGATDHTATAGQGFRLTGKDLKLVGPEPEAGLTLTDRDGHSTRIAATDILCNYPKQLLLILPKSLTPGEYTLTLRTFYSKSARVLKTARKVSVDLMILPHQPG